MRIFIITMDDPVETVGFIKKIIVARKHDIVGVATSKGDRMKISKGKSKFAYLVSLFLIMGPFFFLKNALITVSFKLRKKLSKYGLCPNPSIIAFAKKHGIKTWQIKTPNSKKFRAELETMNIDLIINQSQNIVKKELLSIPRIGTINRHNALLPRNRGRLTPFWVLFRREPETGVSIHFVEEGLDSGDIIIQKKFPVAKGETFRSLVKKNYQVAPVAILEAIDKLEKEDNDFMYNDDDLATYNTTPTLNEAIQYRKQRIGRIFSFQ